MNKQIASEKSELENFQKLKIEANNEILNAEGISERAQLSLTIISMEQVDKNLPLKLLSLRIIYRNSQQNTMKRNPYNLNFNENFGLYSITNKFI